MQARSALLVVKVVHTVVWAFFASCILAMPVAALAGRLRLGLVLALVVMGEVAVLAANRMRCPLTDVAERYTEERADNFDIYLPLWLAKNNKQVFGTAYLVGIGVLIWCWFR